MNNTEAQAPGVDSELERLRAKLLGAPRPSAELVDSRVARDASTIRELRSWMRTATAMIYHGSIERFHGARIARVTCGPDTAPHTPVLGILVCLHVQVPGEDRTVRLFDTGMASWSLYWLDEPYSAARVEGVDGDPAHDPAGTVRVDPATGQPVARTASGRWVFPDSHTPTLGVAVSVVRGWRVAYRPARLW